MTDVIDRLQTALGDRYVLEHELGAGSMATVYLAQDVKHDRKVALKVLRPELVADCGIALAVSSAGGTGMTETACHSARRTT